MALTSSLTPMLAKALISERRRLAPWVGTYADLKKVDDALSECFRDQRRREQSEWVAGNPDLEKVKSDTSDLDRDNAEGVRSAREPGRNTRYANFAEQCWFEFFHQTRRMTGNFDEICSSLDGGRVKRVNMMHTYCRDDTQCIATVHFGLEHVLIIAEGSDRLWVDTTADLLERKLRARRPRWAPLISGWGYKLFQFAIAGLFAAIGFRIADGLHQDTEWWGWVGFIVFIVMGNAKLRNWLLPGVDIHGPTCHATGITHLRWVGGAIAAATVTLLVDILLRR
jgi:hypothetical protein